MFSLSRVLGVKEFLTNLLQAASVLNQTREKNRDLHKRCVNLKQKSTSRTCVKCGKRRNPPRRPARSSLRSSSSASDSQSRSTPQPSPPAPFKWNVNKRLDHTRDLKVHEPCEIDSSAVRRLARQHGPTPCELNLFQRHSRTWTHAFPWGLLFSKNQTRSRSSLPNCRLVVFVERAEQCLDAFELARHALFTRCKTAELHLEEEYRLYYPLLLYLIQENHRKRNLELTTRCCGDENKSHESACASGRKAFPVENKRTGNIRSGILLNAMKAGNRKYNSLNFI